MVSADTFERPIYAGNAIATVQRADAVKVTNVLTTGFDTTGQGAGAAVETAAAVCDSGKSSFVGSELVKSERPDLTVAKIVVSGGRALGSSEKFNDVLAPQLDTACGISGAIQHLADMKDSTVIVAINKDPRGTDLLGRRLRPGSRLACRCARTGRPSLRLDHHGNL